MNWFGTRCRRWRRSIALLASGALPEEEMTVVRAHLAECAACWKYFVELKSVTTPLADWEKVFSRVEPGPALQKRWADEIQMAITAESPVRRPTPTAIIVSAWRELIRPCRGAWAGMVVLWLVMWGIHLTLSADQTMVSTARPASAPAFWQALAEQRQVLAELLPPTAREPAERPRVITPQHGPRSQNATRWRVA